MSQRTSRIARLFPYAAALALALVAPLTATAQTPAAAPAAAQGDVKDLPLGAAERQRYVGRYTVTTPEGTMVLRVYEEGEKLMGVPEGDPEPSRLLYQGDHTFRPEMNVAMKIVFTVADDRATKFTLTREGMTMEAIRTQ